MGCTAPPPNPTRTHRANFTGDPEKSVEERRPGGTQAGGRRAPGSGGGEGTHPTAQAAGGARAHPRGGAASLRNPLRSLRRPRAPTGPFVAARTRPAPRPSPQAEGPGFEQRAGPGDRGGGRRGPQVPPEPRAPQVLVRRAGGEGHEGPQAARAPPPPRPRSSHWEGGRPGPRAADGASLPPPRRHPALGDWLAPRVPGTRLWM